MPGLQICVHRRHLRRLGLHGHRLLLLRGRDLAQPQAIEQPADAQARQPDEQVDRRDANSKELEESRFQIIGARPDLRKEIAELSLAACDPFRSGGNVAGIGREPGMRKKEKEVKRGAKKDNAIPPGKIPGVCALGEVSDQRERLSA